MESLSAKQRTLGLIIPLVEGVIIPLITGKMDQKGMDLLKVHLELIIINYDEKFFARIRAIYLTLVDEDNMKRYAFLLDNEVLDLLARMGEIPNIKESNKVEKCLQKEKKSMSQLEHNVCELLKATKASWGETVFEEISNHPIWEIPQHLSMVLDFRQELENLHPEIRVIDPNEGLLPRLIFPKDFNIYQIPEEFYKYLARVALSSSCH